MVKKIGDKSCQKNFRFWIFLSSPWLSKRNIIFFFFIFQKGTCCCCDYSSASKIGTSQVLQWYFHCWGYLLLSCGSGYFSYIWTRLGHRPVRCHRNRGQVPHLHDLCHRLPVYRRVVPHQSQKFGCWFGLNFCPDR